MQFNVLIVSDLHFGEDLLPGASVEKRRAVALGASTFCDFLRHHGQRRLDGKPWRLVVAGDLFDFMSVTLTANRELPARTSDERRAGRSRSVIAGPLRMREIAKAHQAVLAAMVRFAAAGNQIDILVGNHDLELLDAGTQEELQRQLLEVGRSLGRTDAAKAVARIRVQPWFVYIPKVAWIEHGHVYDEACSSEFNLAPSDPATGELIANVDYAAVRYLAQAAPELDPHGTEEWGFGGYLRYAAGRGMGSFVRLIAGYVRFTGALLEARTLHRSTRRRRDRRDLHRRRVAEIAAAQGLPVDAAQAIDRMARTPVTKSAPRLFAMLMLDRWMAVLGGNALAFGSLLLLSGWMSLLVIAMVIAGLVYVSKRGAGSTVGSQIPMLAVPDRIRNIVDAPVVVFGHTHDPTQLELRNGGTYLNSGTWLPASRPGLLRSFTHVMIRASKVAGAPRAEIRQWRDGRSLRYTEAAAPSAATARPPPQSTPPRHPRPQPATSQPAAVARGSDRAIDGSVSAVLAASPAPSVEPSPLLADDPSSAAAAAPEARSLRAVS